MTIRKKDLYLVVLIEFFVVLFCVWRHLPVDNFAYKLILGLLSAICLMFGLKEENKINPFTLFALTPVSLLIYDKSVSTHYLVDLSDETYLFAILNILAVISGFFLCRRIKTPVKTKNVWHKGVVLQSFSLERNAIYLMVLGLIPTFWGCVTRPSFLLSFNLNGMKNAVNSAPLASIFQLFLYPGMVCAIKSRKKKLIVLCFLMLALSVILNFSKTTVAMMSIVILITIYNDLVTQFDRRKRFKLIIAVGLAAFVLYNSFAIYNNIRHDYDTDAYFLNLGYVGNVSQAWFLPYMYLISSWSNLQYIMETTTNYTWGLWCIKPFLSYLQLDGVLNIKYSMIPRYTAFNTFTYISAFYIDFGEIGAVLCSFVFGVFIMWVYRLYLNYSDSPYVISIWGLNVYAIVMLFFNNHYLQMSYPITIIILMWIWSKITK